MRTRALRASLAATALLTLTVLVPAASVRAAGANAVTHPARSGAARGGPGVWTKIAGVDSVSVYPGILRTNDGNLHVLWRKASSGGHFSYGYTTVGLNGTTQNTGTALSNWDLESEPVLVHDGNGIRALFEGKDVNPGFFANAFVYTLTSSMAGTSWALPHNSVMKQNTLNQNFSATAEQDDTPVAVGVLNGTMFVHEGLDNSAPAAAPDTQISLSPNGIYFNQTAVTASDGSVWVAYFRGNDNPEGNDGYYAQQVLPSVGQAKKAPDSHLNGKDNEPRQGVAFAARAQGGLYMAYCVPTSTKVCAHVDLWKVGSSTPKVVPGTASGTITRVALADGLQGRISVVTMDPTKLTINAVRTNQAVTAFGKPRIIKLPKGTFQFANVQAEGTFGRLDIVANLNNNVTPNLWHTQIQPGLSLTASPKTFSHTAAHTVTFTVKDAGDPVEGAKVTCIGKSDLTNANGVAQITFPKGTAVGHHVCSATHADYNPGKVTITVT